MRVCDLTTLYLDGGQGGVNTYLEEKARYFAERGVAHAVVVPGKRTRRAQLYGSELYTIKSPPLPSNPEHRVLAQFGQVQRFLREFRPDVVEVDCAYLLGKVAAAADRCVPVLGFYHVHLPTFIARPSAARFSSRLAAAAEHWAWRYVDYCYRHCDRLIVSSTDMRSRLEAPGLERLECLPLGVNLELFQPGEQARGPEDPCRILYVGRLSREKDVPVLLDAFQRLTPSGRYRLDVVGDGPLRARLERQAQSDGRITFWGGLPYGEELARRYAAADVLVMPSPNETFSLTVLEGMAAGLPVVAARRGGPTDLVVPGTGELARPSDPADFAAKLAQVAESPERYAQTRAHAQRYAWEATFEALLEIYGRALSRRNVVA
ncbi:MAG: glycosyltransferase [Planctomycetota bacterium]